MRLYDNRNITAADRPARKASISPVKRPSRKGNELKKISISAILSKSVLPESTIRRPPMKCWPSSTPDTVRPMTAK